jgi:hypothetical protein
MIRELMASQGCQMGKGACAPIWANQNHKDDVSDAKTTPDYVVVIPPGSSEKVVKAAFNYVAILVAPGGLFNGPLRQNKKRMRSWTDVSPESSNGTVSYAGWTNANQTNSKMMEASGIYNKRGEFIAKEKTVAKHESGFLIIKNHTQLKSPFRPKAGDTGGKKNVYFKAPVYQAAVRDFNRGGYRSKIGILKSGRRSAIILWGGACKPSTEDVGNELDAMSRGWAENVGIKALNRSVMELDIDDKYKISRAKGGLLQAKNHDHDPVREGDVMYLASGTPMSFWNHVETWVSRSSGLDVEAYRRAMAEAAVNGRGSVEVVSLVGGRGGNRGATGKHKFVPSGTRRRSLCMDVPTSPNYSHESNYSSGCSQ